MKKKYYIGVLASVLLLNAATIASAATVSPILWYNFDDNANPTTNSGTLGSAYNGNLLGNPQYVSFNGGLALKFDGNTDFVVPNGSNSAFNIANSSFSVFSRIQTTNYEPGVTSIRAIVWKESQGYLPGWDVGIIRGSGLVSFAMCDGSNWAAATSDVAVNDGNPHDILAVRSDQTLSIFIDNVFSGNTTIPSYFGSTSNQQPLTIGGRQMAVSGATGGINDDFNGIIDEIRIYNQAINPVPVPGAVWLFGTGLVGLAGLRRKKKC